MLDKLKTYWASGVGAKILLSIAALVVVGLVFSLF